MFSSANFLNQSSNLFTDPAPPISVSDGYILAAASVYLWDIMNDFFTILKGTVALSDSPSSFRLHLYKHHSISTVRQYS